ncbi:Maf-like protein [Robertkochia aurantiaca]|uniref:Maf-like protein n=1 Tax=Robertkochia aurantiaca TaxID=2873700 RepID=UPI001CCC9B1B|nr:Maf-like protein [Robertkochia sp. 3YJGBD-33]
MINSELEKFNIILASGSPRRQQFFKDLGLNFEVRLKPVDEVYPERLYKYEISDYLAQLKALPFKEELKDNDILITSDTIVWHEEKALGKPSGKKEAYEMLRSLSGKEHEVITSVCFTSKKLEKTVNHTTRVKFRELTEDEINHYIENFEPFDKAGAYGIQEWIGLIGISEIQGSYFNVVGLPTFEVYQNLKIMASI